MLEFSYAPCEPPVIIDTNVPLTGANRRFRCDVVLALRKNDDNAIDLTTKLDQHEGFVGVLAAETVVGYLRVSGPDLQSDVFTAWSCAEVPARQQRSLRMLRTWLHPHHGERGALVESFAAMVTPDMWDLLNPTLVLAWLRAFEDCEAIVGSKAKNLFTPYATLDRLLTDYPCCEPGSD